MLHNKQGGQKQQRKAVSLVDYNDGDDDDDDDDRDHHNDSYNNSDKRRTIRSQIRGDAKFPRPERCKSARLERALNFS